MKNEYEDFYNLRYSFINDFIIPVELNTEVLVLLLQIKLPCKFY